MIAPKKKTILFLAANPSDTTRLKLGAEVNEIQDGLSQATYRDCFVFEQVWATTPRDMQRAILRLRPQIVHFSGHGSGEDGLILEDDEGQAQSVNAYALSGLFALFADCVECVVLNACYSKVQANAIAQHIPFTIGMNQAIGDKAAIAFAVGFYEALGEGYAIDFAFKSGCTSVAMHGISEDLTPVLIPQAVGQGPQSAPPAQIIDSRKAVVVAENSPKQKSPTVKKTVSARTSYTTADREEIILASQEGAVDLKSKFYIHSPLEERAYEATHKPGALIRIKSPQGMGKSSLTIRVLAHAKSQGHRVVTLDFKQTNMRCFQDLDKFAQWFCASVSRPFGVRVKVAEYWDDIFGPNDNCTEYFEQYLLMGSPLTLALENFDRLFDYPEIEVDFCGLLRGWNEKAKRDERWGNLRLIIVYSQESYVPKDINQSPFNVGLPIELGPWTVSEISELSIRYGMNLSATELEQIMTLTGGHPQLVNLALSPIAAGTTSLSEIVTTAATEAGIYRSHLVERLNYLEEHPELKVAMTQVVSSNVPVRLRSQDAYRLDSMGLVKRHNNEVAPLCKVYRAYFRERLIA